MTLMPGRAQRRLMVADLRVPGLVGAAGLGAAVLLHLHDPHDSGSYGYCPFLELTGKPCPGCGGLRAVNDLTRGDLIGAVSSNVFAVLLVVVLSAGWVLWLLRRLRGTRDQMFTLSSSSGFAMIGVLVIFGIIRNTPWGSWLAP